MKKKKNEEFQTAITKMDIDDEQCLNEKIVSILLLSVLEKSPRLRWVVNFSIIESDAANIS